MYHIVKAKFATRNPSAGEQSLLESFACLLDIANTDNYEHVWKVINDCDLDFNEAAERLLSQPAPFPSPPAVRTMTEGSAAISTGTISTPPTTIRSACPDLDRILRFRLLLEFCHQMSLHPKSNAANFPQPLRVPLPPWWPPVLQSLVLALLRYLLAQYQAHLQPLNLRLP
jgi:hypothetical protein